MSAQYDLYLQQHKENVAKGLAWIQKNLPELLSNAYDVAWQTEFAHDASKNEPDEYEAYDKYFYGNNRSYQVVQDYTDEPGFCTFTVILIIGSIGYSSMMIPKKARLFWICPTIIFLRWSATGGRLAGKKKISTKYLTGTTSTRIT